jgi:hypothetical protein
MAELIFKNLETDKHNVLELGAIEVTVNYPDGTPAAGAAYELSIQPKGDVRKGVLDAAGRLMENNLPSGAKGELRIVGAPIIALAE